MYKVDNRLMILNSLSKISNILERFKDFYTLDALHQFMHDEHMKFGKSCVDKCGEGFSGVNEFFDYFDSLLDKFEELRDNKDE